MRRYLDDPAAAAGAVTRGLARARHYSWDASAGTLVAAYRAVLERRASSSHGRTTSV
jgi:hypothetical protein